MPEAATAAKTETATPAAATGAPAISTGAPITGAPAAAATTTSTPAANGAPVMPSLDLGAAKAEPFKVPDAFKHLEGEFGKLGDKAADAYKGIELQHAHRVAEVKGWVDQIQARPAYKEEHSAVSKFLVANASKEVIADLNATGYAAKPAIFEFLLGLAKRGAGSAIVRPGDQAQKSDDDGQAALRKRFPSSFAE